MVKSIINAAKNIAKRNKILKSIAFKFYGLHEEKKAKKEFYSRIKSIDIKKYVDTSNKPDLNVVILTIDCLRYSNLSFTGYHRETTPFLDSLNVKFRAVSAAPWTYPSVPSILTGMYPHNHNAYIHSKVKHPDYLKDFKPLRKSVLTLPEILFALDYDIYFGTTIGLARFPLKGRIIPKIYQEDDPAGKLLKDLRKWIIKRRKSFFAYLHLGDIHEPFAPPTEFRSYFGKLKEKPEKEKRILLYDNILRYVDSAIERFYRFLEDSGLLDSTIIVITADHGEEFWEHAELETKYFYDPRGHSGGHGHNVFNEIIEVPILIDGAVRKKRDYTENRVSSVDITPTILDLLEVSHNLTLDGLNLFDGAKKEKRPIISEATGYGYEKKALIVGRYKLLYAPEDSVQWVFDLKKDPFEQHPIEDERLTSMFVDKLNKMLREDEKRRLNDIIRLNKLKISALDFSFEF